jgi:hypothetical protein
MTRFAHLPAIAPSFIAPAFIALSLVACGIVPRALAEEMPSFSIEFKDGTIAPMRLEVPAGKPFKIELHNTGKSAAEFESVEMHREKVISPDSSTFVVIRRLDAGEYKFFDDFAPDAPQALIVAK